MKVDLAVRRHAGSASNTALRAHLETKGMKNVEPGAKLHSAHRRVSGLCQTSHGFGGYVEQFFGLTSFRRATKQQFRYPSSGFKAREIPS
jgi:hypothetical protein